MLNDNELELLESYIIGKTTEEESEEIKKRLIVDINYKKEYEDLLAMYSSLKNYENYKSKKKFLRDVDISSKKNNYSALNKIVKHKYLVGIAASILLISFLNFFSKNNFDESDDVFLAKPNDLDSLFSDSLKIDTVLLELK